MRYTAPIKVLSRPTKDNGNMRLDQPIFYPVLSEDYAVRIARDWNVGRDGAGYVMQFEVLASFLDAYTPHEAGGQALREYWIPAEDLPKFNDAIVGEIIVTKTFKREYE